MSVSDIKPILIKAGSNHILLGELRQPPKVDCYVVAASKYESLTAKVEALEKERDLLQDKSYLNGLKSGWNLGLADDVESFNAAVKSRQLHIDQERKLLNKGE